MEFNHNDEQDKINLTQNTTTQGKKKAITPYVTGGIIGGIIVTLFIALLLTTNVISFESKSPDEIPQIQAQEPDTSPTTNMVSTDDKNPTNIEELTRAVVGIVNIQQRDMWSPNEEAGAGSGIIYKKENGKAYIVTNNHVVQGAEEVEVDINNEKRIAAKVLGTDPLTDLAVLEIDGSEIEYVAELGISDDLTIGETVLAIGNPLGMDFSGSVTKGIISGLNRAVKVDTTGNQQADWIAEVIQTDAAINPGNSGGALFNAKGHVIGINSMKIARSAVEGIGFAIPIDTALPIMEQLEASGEVTRPAIGIGTAELSQVPPQYQHEVILPETIEKAVVIATVQPGSPADKAGLQQFDVITKINGQEITSTLDLRKFLYSETKIGETIKLEFYRSGEATTVDLILSEPLI